MSSSAGNTWARFASADAAHHDIRRHASFVARNSYGYRAPRICHFEGAPHGTSRTAEPCARPRNLLSESSWLVAASRTSPVRHLRDRMLSTAAASILARADTGFLGPATSGTGDGGQRGRASE